MDRPTLPIGTRVRVIADPEASSGTGHGIPLGAACRVYGVDTDLGGPEHPFYSVRNVDHRNGVWADEIEVIR